MTVAAGLRRRVVRVEQHDGTKNSAGHPDYVNDAYWRTVNGLSSLTVSLEAVSGGEVIRGRQMEATANALVRCLSTPRTRQILPKMRLVYGDRKLYVRSVLDLTGRGEDLNIQVGETADGT